MPDTKIYICENVRLNSKYEHSIYFPTATAQREYFAGKVVKTFSAYTYYRRYWERRVEATIEEAKNWNYLFLTNTAGSTEYQYYFINRIEYINENTVALHLELDVIQTYLFKMNLLPCFVERQHTVTDELGENTIDEGLDVGEYVNNNRYDVDDLKDLSVMALCTVDISVNPVADDNGDNKYGSPCYATVRNKIFNGMGVFASELNDYNHISETLSILDNSHPDAMVAMWMYPTALITTDPDQTEQKGFKRVTNANPALLYEVNRPTTLNGYTPKNKKLYNYPYSLLYATNNAGATGVYRWELFDTSSVKGSFRIRGAFTPDGGAKLIPQNYKGVEDNADESLVLSGFPSCAWSSDEYKIWLAQNRNQQAQAIESANVSAALGVGGGLVSMVAGLATMNPLMIAGGVGAAVHSGVSGYQQIESIMAQKEDRSIQPPQARGSFSSNINIVDGCHTFSFYDRCIRGEYAKQIDDYFTMYGYKINRVQVPNLHARSNHTYIKTVGCHVAGNLNNEDITKIESVFNNGVTFWTNGDTIGNYSADNRTL